MTMTLLLKCADVGRTKAFYSDILHFDVSDSAEGTCTARKAEGTLIFTDQDLWRGRPHCTGTIYFFLADVDGYHEAVRQHAKVLWPPEDMPHGTREFGIEDCNGYTLAFARTI